VAVAADVLVELVRGLRHQADSVSRAERPPLPVSR
jgi:hypothetical protein